MVITGILIVVLVRMIPWWKREREAEATRPPRTEAEKARDQQTAKIWGCLAIALPVLLVLAYFLTR